MSVAKQEKPYPFMTNKNVDKFMKPNGRKQTNIPFVCIPNAEKHKLYDPFQSKFRYYYDIGGKAQGERKGYMLRCHYCNSIYKYNSHNPLSHIHTNKCMKSRGIWGANSTDWFSIFADECRNQTRAYITYIATTKNTGRQYLKEHLQQELIQIFYTTKETAVRRITYCRISEEIEEEEKKKEALNKISNWFLQIKYSPHYKYGRKYINSLYNEIAEE